MRWLKKLFSRFRKPKRSFLERIGIEAIHRHQRGEKNRDVVVNSSDFNREVFSLGAKRTLHRFGEFFRMHTPVGAVRVFPDPDCPVDYFKFVDLEVAP